MPTFTLHYEDDGLGLDKRVEFDGSSPATALEIASSEPPGREAILSADGQPICRLAHADRGLWVVARAIERRCF